MDTNNTSSLSQATTIEAMGTFWDTHDLTDYDTDQSDASFTFRRTIAIEMQLYEAIERAAQVHGVSPETLINLWLQQKVQEEQVSI